MQTTLPPLTEFDYPVREIMKPRKLASHTGDNATHENNDNVNRIDRGDTLERSNWKV